MGNNQQNLIEQINHAINVLEAGDSLATEYLIGLLKAVQILYSPAERLETQIAPNMTDKAACPANTTTKPTAPELLAKAAQHMLDRAATYDAPQGERSMGKCVAAFNAITGQDLTEAEGWLLMQVLKDVRLFTRAGYHADSAEDCIAYAALTAEAKAREVKNDK